MTTFGEYWSVPGLIAGASLASSQYYVVQLSSTAGQVKIGSDPTAAATLGLLQNKPAANDAADVAVLGIAKGKAGGSITVGAALTTNTTGEVVVTTTANNKLIGKAAEAASDGDVFRVILAPSNF